MQKRVGAPNYQKTPIFKKRVKYNKKNELNEWNDLRNFKITKLEKKVNDTDIIVDKIRSNLNKLTKDNYELIKTEIIDLINNDVDTNKNVERSCYMYFYMEIKTNFFWSDIYAKLYRIV